MNRSFLTRYAWLSIAAALATIGLKTAAYLLTGSVGLLSDALESFVNLAGASLALLVLYIAAQPPDEDHAYGHTKAEYFSSGVEGALILLAAASIVVAAIDRFLHPVVLQSLGLGLAVSVVASAINLGVALVLRSASLRHRSPTLEANAAHLFTDVGTSVGVLAAVGLVAVSGLTWLDPLIAVLVALNITRAGVQIVRKSALGLMDASLPKADLELIAAILEKYNTDQVRFHALRTRQSGPRRFVSVHVLVPGAWTVQRGHRLLERIEADLRAALKDAVVFTHLESVEDSASWEDQSLDRG